MRLSELLALRWEDVDLERRRVIIHRAVSAGVEGPTKSRQARSIPLADATAAALARLADRGDYTERDDYVFEALRAGASGFLLKNSPPEDLVHAVRVVAAGDALLAPSVTRTVIEGFAQRQTRHIHESELGRLTDRETEILRLLATGKSNSELAAHLFLGEGTIKTHVSSVLTKLGLRDRMQAVIFAYESGLIEPGQQRE